MSLVNDGSSGLVMPVGPMYGNNAGGFGCGEESYRYPYMMGDRSWDDLSYARGRSPMTGRYVSRDNRSYERGYSSEDEKEQMYRALDEMRVKIDKMK